MKTVYLIQTHKNLAQISRLVRRITRDSPEAQVRIVHHTAQFAIDPATFADLPRVQVTHVRQAHRGDFSLVRPCLEVIDTLLEQGDGFDWLVFLSGQCYPARPLASFEELLARGEFDAYMQFFDAFEDSPENLWGLREARHRYLYQYHRLRRAELPATLRKLLSVPRRIVNNTQPFVQLDTSYGALVGLRATSPFSERFRCFGGSHFKALSRASASYLSEFTRRHPEIVNYFSKTILPEESLVQTVLANNAALRLHNKCLCYVDWRGGRLGHPRTLGVQHYRDIAASGAFFARKFDMRYDTRILDVLDRRAANLSRAEQDMYAAAQQASRSYGAPLCVPNL